MAFRFSLEISILTSINATISPRSPSIFPRIIFTHKLTATAGLKSGVGVTIRVLEVKRPLTLAG